MVWSIDPYSKAYGSRPLKLTQRHGLSENRQEGWGEGDLGAWPSLSDNDM